MDSTELQAKLELQKELEVELRRELSDRFVGLPNDAYTYSQMRHFADQWVDNYRKQYRFDGYLDVTRILYLITGR